MDSMEQTAVTNPPGRSLASQLTLFAAKTLIAATIVVVAILIVAVHIENKISQAAEQFQKIAKVGGPDFWRKVEDEIDRASDPQRGLTPAKKQQILTKLRAISTQWRPFVKDAYSALAEDPKEPGTPRN